MELDEAIEYEEEMAEINQAIAYNTNDDNWMDIAQCEKCAEEHLQLAEWLKELKAYQKAHEEMRKLPIVWEFGEEVSRCLSIIEDCLKEVNADADND